MDPSPPSDPHGSLPESLVRQLELLRRHLWRVKITQTICCGLAGALTSYLVLLVSDRLWDTPPPLRLGVFLAGIAGFAILVPYALQRWVWGHRRFLQLGRFVARAHPRLGDRLIGAIELAEQGDRGASSSSRLREAALAQVADQTARLDLTATVQHKPLRRWAAASVLLGAGALAALLAIPQAGRNALARWARPLAEIQRYTFAQLRPLETERVVPIGEPFAVVPALAEDSPWKPQRASARFPGQPRRFAEAVEGEFPFEIPGQNSERTLRLHVGDARHRVRILPTTRPELTALLGRVQLPEYLGYPEQEIDLRRGAADLLQGSSVRFIGTVSRDLKQASLTASPTRVISVQGSTFASEPVAIEAGTQQVVLAWEDVKGLAPREPFAVKITTLEDRAPAADAEGMARVIALLEEDTLNINLLARDDFGVKEVGIQWQGETPEGQPSEVQGRALAREGSFQATELPAALAFQPKAHSIAPQKLQLWVYALDYRPGREPGLSSPFTVFVLDRAQHAQLLQQEFSKLQDSLEEIARVEESLRETNRQLKEMDPESMQSPEGQQQMAQQEEAEERNARSLERLREQGQDLFQEAVKNKDIDPGALDEWSQMLSMMQEVSSQDMPQVASSLSQAQQSAASGNSQQSQQEMDEALAKQQEILDKLSKAMGKADRTMELLEASTFINRLRKAARTETQIGGQLEKAILETVGRTTDELEEDQTRTLQSVEEFQLSNGQEAGYIQEDLLHFSGRTAKPKYAEVAKAMQEAKTSDGLQQLATQIRFNQAGRAIGDARFWAAKFTEWAKMLSPDEEGGEGGEGGESQGEPDYELLLRIMRVIQQEMAIREQTRALERTKEGNPSYASQARTLAGDQMMVGKDVHDIMEDYPIPMLHQLLIPADVAIADATGLLNQPDTGGSTIAAETEVIEILANAGQSMGQGGGAGMASLMQMMMSMGMGQTPGGNPGGGLSDRGNEEVTGDPAGTRPGERTVEKTSGRPASELPVEFREALGRYFEAVDQIQQ